jgi:hypothetical protein
LVASEPLECISFQWTNPFGEKPVALNLMPKPEEGPHIGVTTTFAFAYTLSIEIIAYGREYSINSAASNTITHLGLYCYLLLPFIPNKIWLSKIKV